MARWRNGVSDEDEDEDAHEHEDDVADREDPDPADQDPDEGDDDDDDSATVPCPNCRRPVYDDVDYCPHCGEAITPTGGSGVPTWAWVTAVILLLAIVLTGFLAW